MTWKDRITLGICGRAGCPLKAANGENYCGRHAEDQRERAKKCARARRRAAKVQLQLGWPA